MILVDANVLVYAHVRSFSQHKRARQWLDSQFNSGSRVGLPWPSLLGFLRLVTNGRVFSQPESMSDAWRQVALWLAADASWIPQPTDRHQTVLAELLGSSRASGNLVPDAHLAALAMEHGLLLCSADGDFARFPGLRFSNPLAA